MANRCLFKGPAYLRESVNLVGVHGQKYVYAAGILYFIFNLYERSNTFALCFSSRYDIRSLAHRISLKARRHAWSNVRVCVHGRTLIYIDYHTVAIKIDYTYTESIRTLML